MTKHGIREDGRRALPREGGHVADLGSVAVPAAIEEQTAFEAAL